MRFELVPKNSNRPAQPLAETITHLPTSMPYMNEADDVIDIEESEELDVIKVRVASVDWLRGHTNSSRMPDAVGRLVRLPVPEAPPDPNSMHIFVQFQVTTEHFG